MESALNCRAASPDSEGALHTHSCGCAHTFLRTCTHRFLWTCTHIPALAAALSSPASCAAVCCLMMCSRNLLPLFLRKPRLKVTTARRDCVTSTFRLFPLPITYQLWPLLCYYEKCWRDFSAVKSTSCSSRRPGLSAEPPRPVARKGNLVPLAPVNIVTPRYRHRIKHWETSAP